jgi:MFS family permease
MNPNERNIMAITSFGHFISHFNLLVFPALVLPLSARFGMDLSQVITLAFWMYLLFGASALAWGVLSDIFGARHLLMIFFIGAGLSALVAAFSLGSPRALSLCLAGVGLFSGIYHPAGLGLISRGVSKVGMAMGYNGIAGNLGLAASPLMTGTINYFLGAKAAFLFLGGFNLFGALVLMLFPIYEPERKKSARSKSSENYLAGFLILCVCMMLSGIAYRMAAVIMPSYFELQNQELFQELSRVPWLSASRNVAATAFTSLVFLIGALGQYLGGWVVERYEPRRSYILFHSVACLLALMMAYTTDIPLILITAGYIMFLMGGQPIENTLVTYFTPVKLRDSAFGIKAILSFGVGSLSVHLVGWIKTGWSLQAVFVAASGISVLAILAGVVLIAVTRDVRFKVFK